MKGIVSASTARESFMAGLLLIGSACSLLLGAVGVYGVVASTVRRRTAEIGIRVALGADPTRVAALVLRQSLPAVLAGLVIGVAGALAGGRALRSLLFEVAPNDPLAPALGALVLAVVASLAAYVPARRAAKIDPSVALRVD